VAEGVFVSNTWKEKPETAALLRRLMSRSETDAPPQH
jgi:hypothetical protein